MPKRGDIVLVPFPFSDLSGEKVRPALVLSKQHKGVDVIVVFITSKHKLSAGATVPVLPSSINGIKLASVIVCDKIATLDKKIILGQLGHLERELQMKVDATITRVLGL
jgi:mRNA interferase MazF